jgi:molecular chaperone DnaJ
MSHSSTHRYYDLLDVPRSATENEIKKAYKKQALQHHPDKGGDAELFQNIQSAYETLKDSDKRAQYDQLGDARWKEVQEQSGGGGGGGGMGGHGFPGFHVFEQMFGNLRHNHNNNQTNQRVRKSDQLHAISITLREAFFGMTKRLNISLIKRCFRCQGICGHCRGEGMVQHTQQNGFFMQVSHTPCQPCKGSGVTVKNQESFTGTCETCNNTGQYKENNMVELIIPSGVSHGFRMRFQGFGEQAVKEQDESGDMYIEIHVQEHPLFKREGANLVFTSNISWKQSILGKVLKIPMFQSVSASREGEGEEDKEDKPLHINTKQWGIVCSDTRYIVPKLGMPVEGESNTRGDLICMFKVSYPDKPLSNETYEAFQVAFKTLNDVYI